MRIQINNEKPEIAKLEAWSQQIWQQGYLIIENALDEDLNSHFLERATSLATSPGYENHNLVLRAFEHGLDFVDLLVHEPVYSLMKHMLGEQVHIIGEVIHRTRQGHEVLNWHADEVYCPRPPESSDDIPYPPVVNVLNCHYYLVDVPVELGPTEVVPYSHAACRQPQPEDGLPPVWQGHESLPMSVKAGDCVIYTNQIWHRGMPNQTDETRYSVVPAYARRFIAQRFWPFLNYHLDERLLDACTPEQLSLLGKHPQGPYG